MKIIRTVALMLATLILLSAVPLAVEVSADNEKLVTNGLIANFDASLRKDSDATKWTDATGKYTVTVAKNDTNYFADGAYHLSKTRFNLPNDMLNCINAKQFTVEMRFGKVYSVGSSYSTVLNTTANDNFSLFLRTNDDHLEFKCSTNARPSVPFGKDLLENSTVTVTYDVDAKKSIMYIDGNEVATSIISSTIAGAGYLAFGHDGGDRSHTIDYEAIRFYNRALTPAEVAQNAKADGNYVSNIASNYVPADANFANILNAPAGVMLVSTKADFDTFKSLKTKPNNLLVSVTNGKLDCGKTLDNIFEACGETVIPNFLLNDTASANAVIDYIGKNNYIDVGLIASAKDEALVKLIRKNANPVVRVGIIYDDITANADTAKIHQVREKVNSLHANYVILPSTAATQANVRALRDLNVVTWAIDVQAYDEDVDLAYCLTSGASGIITSRFERLNSFAASMPANSLTITPLIIGHRGNPTNAPENSISSYLKAVENGADVVETDIYLTKDGQIIIMHDNTIANTTTYTGSATIGQMTLSEIKSYKLYGRNNQFASQYPNETVPTFEEMLIALKDKDCKIFVEFKDYTAECVKEFVRLVKKYNYSDRICVISFGTSAISNVQNQFPEMSTGYLLGNISAFATKADMMKIVKLQIANMQSTSSSLNISYPNLNEAFIDALEMRGFAIWPWTLTQYVTTDSNNLFVWGVDGITTNDCQYYRNTVEYLTYDTSLEIEVGSTKKLGINSVTYKGDKVSVASSASYKIINGEDVISVEKGNITALKNGEADIVVTYNCTLPDAKTKYVLCTSPIHIKVGSGNGNKLQLANGSSLKLESKYVSGVNAGLTVSEMAAQFSTEIKILNKDGKVVTGETTLGTGYTVVATEGEEIVDSREIVVTGDINGDKKVGAADYLIVKRGIELTGASAKAADLDANGKTNSSDAVLIKKLALGK